MDDDVLGHPDLPDFSRATFKRRQRHVRAKALQKSPVKHVEPYFNGCRRCTAKARINLNNRQPPIREYRLHHHWAVKASLTKDGRCLCFKLAVPEGGGRSEEHTSELQSLMRISYAVFCLKKKTKIL